MPTPPRRRLPPELRREQLLDAALDAAAGGDIGAISVGELAARAGVSEGLLYHYFPTKQALVAAAIRRAADALLADLQAATGREPIEQLIAGLSAYLDHVQAQPTSWRALLQARTGELAVISADIEARALALVLQALSVSEPSATLLITLTGWAAFERDACLGWLEHPEVSRQTIEDILITSFVQALTAAARHDPAAGQALARLTG